MVEISGIEPLTSCLQGRRSPSWAKPPYPSALFEVVGQNGLAFLRKSHAGCNSPPDCCQEPAFESILMNSLSLKPFASDHHFLFLKWWAKMDSNHRPHDYQSCALASWAIGPYQLHFFLVEISGIEPLTSCLQGRRSPSWAKPPYPSPLCKVHCLSVPSKLNNVNT